MLKRTLTALLGFIAAIILISTGGFLFSAGILVLALLGWQEMSKMFKQAEIPIYQLATGVSIAVLLLLPAFSFAQLLLPALTLSFLVLLLVALGDHADPLWLQRLNASLFVIIYSGVLFAYFILLRNISPGLIVPAGTNMTFSTGEAFIWLVLLGTWASDTFAYLIGCNWGHTKLCPSISPKKTVEGAVAGFCGSVAIVVFLGHKVLEYPLLQVLFLAFLIAVTAPLGDLTESLLKRYCKVKDSGNILPGHGGVLDRFDSLLFVIPVSYYYFLYMLSN